MAGGAGLAALGGGCGAGGESARIKLAAAERLGGDGYGVWHGRRLVGGRNLGLRQESFSITKSLAALAVVRAAGEGWLELDRALGEVLPEWGADPRKCRVTVRMLVNQVAGFPAGEAALYRGRIRDKERAGVALPLIDPGWLAMVGSGGKRVYVLPSRDLVGARLGHAKSWNDGAFLRALSA